MHRPFVSAALGACAVVSLLSAAPAVAAPITYAESVHGDLAWPGYNNPLPTFTVDAGLNTVSGSTFVDLSPPYSPQDDDGFAFVVPDGLEVSSIKIITTRADAAMYELRWYLTDGDLPSRFGDPFIDELRQYTPGHAVSTQTPLGPGTYGLNLIIISPLAFGVSTADYTVILDVHQQVPEPASLGLLAPATLALLRRRRH